MGCSGSKSQTAVEEEEEDVPVKSFGNARDSMVYSKLALKEHASKAKSVEEDESQADKKPLDSQKSGKFEVADDTLDAKRPSVAHAKADPSP